MGIVKVTKKKINTYCIPRHKVSSVTRIDILIQYTFQGLALGWCNFLHYYNNNWWFYIWPSAQHMSIWALQFNSGNGFHFKISKLPRECYSSFLKLPKGTGGRGLVWERKAWMKWWISSTTSLSQTGTIEECSYRLIAEI